MKDVYLLKNNGVDVDKSLELFGEMSMYDDTMGDFLDEVNNKVDSLKKYKEASDMENYAIMVHSLKSDARYLGFTKLAELAYEHEMKSKATDINYVMDNFDALLTETDRIIELCKQYLGRTDVESVKPKEVVKSDKAILVVDDSNLIVNFISKIFDDTFEVIKATDGEQAIRCIENDTNHKIVGMLLDLNMPNVDGFSVLDYFNTNKLFTNIPVSIITGGDDRETINRAFAYPIIDLLAKPFNERDVKRIVEKMLDVTRM